MIDLVLLYAGGAIPFLWGIAHLFPTRSVVKGFGDISVDNRHIITMEWIIEGIAMIFIGLLVGVVTTIDRNSPVSMAVYMLAVGGLIILAVVSLFTGFKVNYLPFKLCPAIFTVSAILIFVGGIL